eukprot:Skav224433  [mRNA]  locus=scaffold3233:99751:104291:+ [translate_table: standard]
MYGSPACLPAFDRSNFLVANLNRKENGIVEADLMKPEGQSVAQTLNGSLLMSQDSFVEKITIQWSTERELPTKAFFLDALDNFFGGSDFIVDSQTVMIPVPEESRMSAEPIRVLELFAGGIAGWKSALRVMEEAAAIDTQVIGLDHDLKACKAYSVAHNAILVDGFHTIPENMFSHGQEQYIIHGDIQDRGWLAAVAAWNPEIATVSAPCPPWSSASESQGLNSPLGLLFAEAIGVLKLLRPAVVLIENVGGFSAHPHYEKIMSQLRWAGYAVKWARVLELKGICPVSRPRWLCLAIRISDSNLSFDRMTLWGSQQASTPRTFDAVLPSSMLHVHDLTIPENALHMARDPALLPPAKRKRMSPDAALKTRCTDPNNAAPVFMAAHGSQHEIKRSFLERKGLMSHSFWDPMETSQPRMWSPLEALALHAMCTSAFLPASDKTTWTLIGNHIAVPHALIMICNAFKLLNHRCSSPDIKQVFDHLHQVRFKMQDLQVINLPGGKFVSMPNAVRFINPTTLEEFDRIAESDQLPTGQIWHCDFGFMDIQEHMRRSIPDAQAAPATQVTHLSWATTEPAASATQAFTPTARGQIILGDEQQVFWFSADVPVNAILAVWENFFDIDPSQAPDPEFSLRLVPKDPYQEEPRAEYEGSLLNLFHEGNLTIYNDTPAARSVITNSETSSLYDQFAAVPEFTKHPNMIATTHAIREVDPEDVPLPDFMLTADDQCVAITRVNERSELTMIITGPQVARDTLAQFWTRILPRDVLQEFHLEVVMESNNASHTIIFRHVGLQCSYPFPALRLLLLTHAFRKIIHPLSHPTGTKHTKIRWLSRVIWQGPLDSGCLMQTVIRCIRIAALPLATEHDSLQRVFRITSRGKSQLPSTMLCEIPGFHDYQSISLNLVRAMKGGGPPITTKQSHVIQAKNSLAGSLLQEGYELSWISQALDQLVKSAGIKPLLPITSMPQGVNKMKAIVQAFQDAGVTMPVKEKQSTSANALHSKTKKRAVPAPEPKNYHVQDGCLLLASDEPASQLKEFNTHQTGFVLTSHEEARPWILEGNTVATDELALLVFGAPDWSTTLKSEQVTLPCWDDQQRSVLVAFTMFQLGENPVRVKQWENQKVPQVSTSLMALTLWRSDWDSQWATISDNPYAFLRSHLDLGTSLVAMWGKSFRDNKKSPVLSPPRRCKYIAPFRKVLLTSAKLPNVFGLAKSGNKLAIRVQATSFEASWKILHPDLEVPDQTATDHLYRLDHLPFGTTASMITAWGNHLSWKLKPIRALGPKGWLVGSPAHPSTDNLAFNGSPILVRYVKPRQAERYDPIVAGPRPTLSKATPLPPLSSDPWETYFGGQAAKPQASTTGSMSRPMPATAGPTDQRFQQQDERFAKLEEHMATLQQQTATHNANIDQIKKDVERNNHDVKVHVDSCIGELRKEIDQSFSQALKNQSSHFDASLQELKQLMIGVAKRKTPGEGDEEM